jgi:hypothetical protein
MSNTGSNKSDFKPYYRAKAIKIVWHWNKNLHKDQWNNVDNLHINPLSCSHVIFDKGAQNIDWRKESLFKWYGEN